MKKLILVTSPPGCGKTYVSKQLAKKLKHVVYLDKDTLIVLSKQIFAVAGQPYDRSSTFFEQNIRDYEYSAIVDLALDALAYDDIVLINAPFTKEIRQPEYMTGLRKRLETTDARLCLIWLVTDPQVCHDRMIARNSDRDTWKLAHWDEYIKTISFEIPKAIDNKDLFLFYNSNDIEFASSMQKVVGFLEETEQDH